MHSWEQQVGNGPVSRRSFGAAVSAMDFTGQTPVPPSLARRRPTRSVSWTCVVCFLLLNVCCEVDQALLLPGQATPLTDTSGYVLVARIAHISDTHIMDEETPARYAGAEEIIGSAWRPYEAYSTQLLDGIIRTINRIHASGRTIDFVMLTGDTCTNCQSNELAWLLAVFDGQAVDPRTGPDDRPPDQWPVPLLDPHAPFTPQGLYRTGVHGDLPSIPWYVVFGNHDRFALGAFPIFQDFWGRRTAPLPLAQRPGLLLPTVLDPLACFAHGNVTPANPGPPCLAELPRFVVPNPQRVFFSDAEFIRAMFTTQTGPNGHGFADAGPDAAGSWQRLPLPGTATCYSTTPVAALRLIGLDTCQPAHRFEAFPYHDGSMSPEQVDFLRAELGVAQDRGELVIVASHHPSASLWAGYGSALAGSSFQSLLNEHPNVALHLAGHSHHSRVSNRGGYLEIETCSTLDLPQEGRIIEIWRSLTDGSVQITYDMFSHLDDELPALGDDPLRGLRENAHAAARWLQTDRLIVEDAPNIPPEASRR